MPRKSEFADILREKMGFSADQPKHDRPTQTSSYYEIPPIMHFIASRRTWPTNRGQSAYPRATVINEPQQTNEGEVEDFATISPEPTAQETLFSTEILGTKARNAYAQLTALGAHLPQEFTLSQVKAEYRRLIKKYHPDYFKGPTDRFDRTLRAHRCLWDEMCTIETSLS